MMYVECDINNNPDELMRETGVNSWLYVQTDLNSSAVGAMILYWKPKEPKTELEKFYSTVKSKWPDYDDLDDLVELQLSYSLDLFSLTNPDDVDEQGQQQYTLEQWRMIKSYYPEDHGVQIVTDQEYQKTMEYLESLSDHRNLKRRYPPKPTPEHEFMYIQQVLEQTVSSTALEKAHETWRELHK